MELYFYYLLAVIKDSPDIRIFSEPMPMPLLLGDLERKTKEIGATPNFLCFNRINIQQSPKEKTVLATWYPNEKEDAKHG